MSISFPTEHSRSPTVVCDMCGGAMKLSRVVAHPEKEGDLHLFECTGCKLPIVRFRGREQPAAHGCRR